MGTRKYFGIKNKTDLGSHTACVTVSLCSSLPLSERRFALYNVGIMIPASLTALQRSQGEDGYANCILYRVVCPLCVLGQDMALSGTFSSLMP